MKIARQLQSEMEMKKNVVETDSFGGDHIVCGLFLHSCGRYVSDVVFDVKVGG